MPWTPRQVRYLLSSGSPLTDEQQSHMKAELHSNPSMGHMKKGYKRNLRDFMRGRHKESD